MFSYKSASCLVRDLLAFHLLHFHDDQIIKTREEHMVEAESLYRNQKHMKRIF